ncbi:Panacea domain-containing protein [Sulfurirhabdus autotrophica]|uniref:Putative phage-associated protein n=1 Tax=Sulfurirhabdus autotrophica TaxID=1706046 RepID=A0A4R3Y2V6_9PROT|nr:type II toxin-antitoxin system antitoxin SocA domain-containing protein [Sulfurirhabdus autotrophica]TCV85917.1 putative phage-associated protein [Sulfurirhabdus autotrophica]
MTISIHAIADCFILAVDRSTGDNINTFKLQKLVYYAQVWHLALHGEPLFSNDIEAWVHGPVCIELHQRFRDQKDIPIEPDAIITDINQLDSNTREFLDEVWAVYGQYSVARLEKMTHEESPWLEARAKLPADIRGCNVINQESMRKFYSSRMTARRRIREN